ncbi:MAG: response regulator transcription factor [Prevotella sp.]|nr:response regulator transcription factor [Prevotella sp.]
MTTTTFRHTAHPVERIIIADPQPLTALAVETLVHQLVSSPAGEEEADLVVSARDRYELTQLLKDGKTSAVVLDYTLFDFADQESLCLLAETYKDTASWILLSDELTADFIRYVLYQTTTIGVAYKDASLDILREALRYTLRGERYISQHATDILLQNAAERDNPKDDLTQTEREVLKSIALGRTTKEIAAERFSSIHTINSHRKNIFRKLGVNCAHDAMKYAFRAGLVDESEFYI